MRVLILVLLMAVTAVQAQAQSTDVRALYDRIDRLERDVQTLQSQLARGGTSSLVVTTPAAAGPTGGGRSSAANQSLSDRVDALEDQIRELTGNVEEANHHASQASSKLDRFMADAELRFKELGDQLRALQPGGGVSADAAPAAEAPGAAGKKQIPPNNSAENPGLAPGPQVLGTISDKDVKKAAAAKDTPKDPKAAYDAAYALYQSNDYTGSADAFRAFLTKYPEHQLAPSAIYWVGQSTYAQKDYKTALTIFADGYKKYPNSTKAADLLYKMGESFEQLNMTKQACGSYRLLFEDHKDMPDRLRKAANANKAKLGC